MSADLRVFAFLWAVGHGYHEAKWSHWLSTPSDFALGVAVALVLLRPASTARLALLAVVQLANLGMLLPEVPNHWLLVGMVNVALLVAIAEAWWAGRRERVDPARVWSSFAPGARAIVLVVYAWAVFHKLNADWFEPTVSCATALIDDWTRLLPLSEIPLRESVYAVAPWAGVLVEAAIPMLLLSRRGRTAGISLALLFHFALGVPRFFNFSAIMLALLFCFAPPDFARALSCWWTGHGLGAWTARIARDERRRAFETAALAALALGIVAVAVTSPWTHSGSAPRLVREVASGNRTAISYVFQALWFPFYVGAVAVFAIVMRRTSADRRSAVELLAAPRRIVMIVAAAAFLNGLLPYVGLKTEGVWAMFSNLRTEGSPNHLLVRTTVDPFGYQSDLVTIVASNEHELARVADRQLALPMYQLRYYLARSRAQREGRIWVDYERGGMLVQAADVETDPTLSEPLGAIVSKLLAFRPIEPTGPVHCRH